MYGSIFLIFQSKTKKKKKSEEQSRAEKTTDYRVQDSKKYAMSEKQTSTFVKKLASNDRKTREAAFEALGNYLKSRSSSKLSLLEMEKLWKGLYFAMWFCDKAGPQEKLAQELANLFSDVIPAASYSTFHEAFWVILIKEWPSIDQWRIDKYYLTIRRILRQNFIRLQKNGWEEEEINEFLQVLEKHVLSGDKSVPVALPYHLCDIYIDEIETVLFADLEEADLEENEEQFKEVFRQKLDIVEKTPVEKLLSPFAKLNKSALLKTLRIKCKEEVLEDQRLKDWGVFETGTDNESEEDDEEEEEWKGF